MTGGTARRGRGAALVCALVLAGCAPTFPSFAGGRLTPAGRSDLALGTAIRVPIGDLANEPALTELAPGGIAPGAFVRHGLHRNVDLGFEVSGPTARAHLRGQLDSGMIHAIAGVAPHVGLGHPDGELIRVGGTVPLVLAIDVLSVYELWLGVRLGVEHLTGTAAGDTISMTGIRTGGVIGFAAGFRRFHVLAELGVDHELWTGEVSDISIERNGLILTPALALRFRM